MGELRLVFRSMPGPDDECILVKAEDSNGNKVNAGEWRKRPDGLVELVIRKLPGAGKLEASQN